MSSELIIALVSGAFGLAGTGALIWSAWRKDMADRQAQKEAADQNTEQRHYELTAKESSDIRAELRQEVRELKESLRTTTDALQKQIDEWREKYYEEREARLALEQQLILANNKINALSEKVADLEGKKGS